MTTEFHTGAVCYIDLLGFSYLTNLLNNTEQYNDSEKEKKIGDKCVKELTLSDLRFLDDYVKFGDSEELSGEKKSDITIADWAYEIVDKNLKKFHEIVEKACCDFQSAEYTAISDSLFIASESADEVLCILSNIFRQSIKSGILLRAGLAYGIYYSVKTHISSFNIYGPAVTKAVSYEKLGKGCRIFTDSDFPQNSKIFSDYNGNIFYGYKNCMNYSTLDCFEWLMINDKYVFHKHDLSTLPKSGNLPKALDLLCDNAEVLCALLYSPKYKWNLKNEAGSEHLSASIEYISALVEKIIKFSKDDELKKLFGKIKDGKVFIKNQERSEKILMDMVSSKQADLKEKFDK